MHYWIVINDNTQGPMTLDELMQVRGLTPQTPVWFDGLANWTTIGQVPDLMARLMQPRNNSADATQSAAGGVIEQPSSPAAPAYSFQAANYAYQQPKQQPQDVPPMPPTNLVWAIIVTICCCLPAGVVAIVYASKVSTLYRRGLYEEAEKASERAMWWVIGGFVGGLVLQPFVSLVQLMAL